ncbi:glycosyltransferase family 4 protein [Paracraurococcus lichenis]|uniref:Glycosyltransferase family 4 protein n=1 Tax=Paracraurococcus lichenis TaxID=3064888 RepID=A0ABT9DWC7_9PROT|nr:glycosyltransferase family 4 protein [Paracraurococcus sp. LOR1-02]MDO9708203.1 glycosyltransferase family 4 protein [Paracraurococcus sp. LOR1-02]
MRIVMATDGPRLGPESVGERPMGGVETAFALLAEAFLRRGHEVELRAGRDLAEARGGLRWAPLARGGAPAALVIANRSPRLFRWMPAGRRVLWLHNPGGYLRKARNIPPMLATWPRLVTLGPAHSRSLRGWMPIRPVEIPLALAPPFDAGATERPPPPPVAVFASNPRRGLLWLLDLWAQRIRPAVPDAELHLYTGAATYGGDARLAAHAAPVLARAEALAGQGVRIFDPLPRAGLAARLREARLMLYRGDTGETFCLALAEAQAMGLPAVVTPLGAVPERVADGVTGVVARDEAGFAAAAIRLLSDDAAWSAMHRAALARGPGPSWDEVAARFEALA